MKLVADDVELVFAARVPERGSDEEAVELRLGQREGALELDRVLVARTMNGSLSSRVTPSIVTWRSAIASSSADCVFGIARLISSTRTTCAKIGPALNSKSRACWFQIERPVTSVG